MKSQELAQTAARPAVQVSLPVFQGPFDLLIYLVERDKLDIYDIAIADITRDYLESLKTIEFDPELASDFIYMAAYLLELKSRSLLPRIGRIQLAEEPDPRQELIMRLVEYKRFKELAAQLDAMEGGDNHLYVRSPSLPLGAGESKILAPMSLDNLYSAFSRALAKARVEIHQLPKRGIPLAEKVEELRLRLKRGPACFTELTTGLGLSGIVVVFLAVLELVRMGEAMVAQESVFSPIRIEEVKGDDGDE